mmetsp:Transcript_66183/g.214015  ORF Transcript_66183/g.214015 Transcript_66183/m.214015 type:complete len:234 (+) Transcript_66183:289-990(+)
MIKWLSVRASTMTRPSVAGACTSPAVVQTPSAPASRSTRVSSPSKAAAARKPEAVLEATAARRPAGNGVAVERWQDQTPSIGEGPHSASEPLEAVRSRPASFQEAPTMWPRPATPESTKGVAKEVFKSTTAPRPAARSKAATEPSWAARSSGRRPSGNWTEAFFGAVSMLSTGRACGVFVSRASARGPRAAARRWATWASSPCSALRRRSQPPAWQNSVRMPLRVQGLIQGCM